jgi:putative transposase
VKNNNNNRQRDKGITIEKKKKKKSLKRKRREGGDDEPEEEVGGDAQDEQNDEEEEPTAWGVRRIRLLPTREQATTLRQWVGAARWTYNQCVAAFREGSGAVAENTTAKALRAHCVNSDAPLVRENAAWLLSVPYDVRDEGMRDFRKALKTTFALKRTGHINRFNMRFRSKKRAVRESIVAHAKHWKPGNVWWKRYLHREAVRSTEPIPDTLPTDTRVVYNRKTNKWYLMLLVPKFKKRENLMRSERYDARRNGDEEGSVNHDDQSDRSGDGNSAGKNDDSAGDNQALSAHDTVTAPLAPLATGLTPPPPPPPPPPPVVSFATERTLSIDPGIRTFATCYDDTGYVYEWGCARDRSRVMRLGLAADKLQHRSDDSECRHRERYLLRRRMARIREKIRNLVDDLHRRLIKWIVTNFDRVVLPPFNGHNMNTRGQRKIRAKTVRQMMSWAHGRFRERLLAKTGADGEYPHCHVYVHEESYTSKTCGACGTLHTRLGGCKTFRCPSNECGAVLDRDANGARNILLKFLTEEATYVSSPARPGSGCERLTPVADNDCAFLPKKFKCAV